MAVITGIEVIDVRFPTSDDLHGSDARNRNPDYSLAYVIAHTDAGPEGHGFTFTIGRGTEIVCAAIEALARQVVGRDSELLFSDLGALGYELTGDSQLRWLGPEKGVIHLATAALVNALWDLHAKELGKPLWQVLADMAPEEIEKLVDFNYIIDALEPDEALDILGRNRPTRGQRLAFLSEHGLPTYTTSVGWMGYSDEEVRRRARQAVADGWDHVKMKVGWGLDDDLRRAAIIREEIGDDRKLSMDANQVWSVDVAVPRIRRLAEFEPWWIEEPTSPDDVLGHATIRRAVAPTRIASGEHAHNRVMFKQLLQAGAIDFCQLDACRLGGVNEVVAVLLLAAKFGVPVCPHAGGVGLSELVAHLSTFNYLCVAPDLTDVSVEYVDHLHEHFVDPVDLRQGRYFPPATPGYSAELKASTLRDYRWPDGPVWRRRRGA